MHGRLGFDRLPRHGHSVNHIVNLRAFGVKINPELVVYVPPSLDVVTTYVLLEQEAWFEDEVDFVRSCVNPGDRAIDVGANFGVYTLALAEAVGPAGSVVAFEPTAVTSAFLRASVAVRHGSRVTVEQAAVSDRQGIAQLQRGASPEMNALGVPAGDSTDSEAVSVVSLDHYLAGQPLRPTAFLKLDAEGHEAQVVGGATELLKRDEPVILFEIKHGKEFNLGLLEALAPFGYAPYRFVPGIRALVPFQRGSSPDPYQLNLFACTPQRAAALRARGLLTDSPPPPQSVRLPIPESPAPGGIFQNDRASAPRDEGYRAALAHYGYACHATTAEARRLHIEEALFLAAAACRQRNSGARYLTYARIARACGHRNEAVRVLGQVVDHWLTRGTPEIDEPCLWPGTAHADTRPFDDIDRLKSAVLEAHERWRGFSSRYAGPPSLPFLDLVCGLPHCSPEMHRRRQLVRLRAKLQSRPEPHPALVVENAGNLNAWFWRGEF